MAGKAFPSITVITPAYNEEACIRGCLDALTGQDYPRELLEIIVVDDHSTDRTREIALEYGVTVIDNGRRDIEYGKMLGLGMAGGELFCIIDADWMIRGKDWLRKMALPLMRDCKISAAVTCYYPHPDDPAINRYITMDPNQMDPIYSFFATHMEDTVTESREGYSLCEFILGKIPPVGATCLHRKDVLLPLISGYSRYADLDFLVLLVESGHSRFAYVPDAGIYHSHALSFGELCRKRLRNVRQCYLPRVGSRKYEWFSLSRKRDVARIVLWALYVHTIIPPLLVGIWKSLKHRDAAGLFEPLVCLGVTDVILYGFLSSRKGLRSVLSG